jgi:hypothetical protein
METILADSPHMFAVYEDILTQIAGVLRTQGGEGHEAAAEGPALDNATLRARLSQALAVLEDFKAKDCAVTVSELLRCRLPKELREMLEDTAEKLRMYDDDEAEAILRQAIALVDAEK